MARIRTIKPEFWTDDTITECSLSARLLFIGIWNFADDAGNLDRSPKQIKARVFPVDNIDCAPLIQELLTHGLLIEYSVSGKKYLHIPGFSAHQVINRPSKPSVPPPPDSMNTHGLITEPSLPTHDGREGKGKERKEEENLVELHSTAPDVPRETSDAESDPLARLRIAIPEQPPDPEPSRNGQPNRTDQATEVFEFWRETMRKPRAQFTPERVKLVTARLRDGYTPDDLKKAVFGCSVTPHNAGHNDRDQRFDDLALICRDGGHVDRFMGNADRPPALEPRR